MKKKSKADAYLVEAASKCVAFLYTDLDQAKKSASRLCIGGAKVFPLYKGKQISS